MIERIVLLKLNDEHANDAGRDAVIAEARRVLPDVPGVAHVSVGGPADDPSQKSWDIVFIVRLERLEDLVPYGADPDHRAFVDRFLAPRVACRKAWNFTI